MAIPNESWVADSFAGLPKPDPTLYPADDILHKFHELAVSLEDVKGHFARYGLLDERVVFLRGWFRDTLPDAPIERLALLRIDADMYESTIVALRSLYPKLSPGGFAIIDDYYAHPARRATVDDFRGEHGIVEPMEIVDWSAVFWRKQS